MSKQFTVLMPSVPTELLDALKLLPPPFMQDLTATPATNGIVDIEIAFHYPPGISPGEMPEFEKAAKAAMILNEIMFFETMPHMLTRVLLHLVKTDDAWKEHARTAKLKDPDKPDVYLMKLFIHELVVKGGDLFGVDHRPCWEAGKCLHEEDIK